jgi:hypothetical protein
MWIMDLHDLFQESLELVSKSTFAMDKVSHQLSAYDFDTKQDASTRTRRFLKQLFDISVVHCLHMPFLVNLSYSRVRMTWGECYFLHLTPHQGFPHMR